VVLHPTRHKIAHFGDVLQANLLAWYGKTKPNTTKAHIYQSKETTKNNRKKLKPGLVASYDIWPGNAQGLFWFRRFINLSLAYLLRHLPTYFQPRELHWASYLTPELVKNTQTRGRQHKAGKSSLVLPRLGARKGIRPVKISLVILEGFFLFEGVPGKTCCNFETVVTAHTARTRM